MLLFSRTFPGGTSEKVVLRIRATRGDTVDFHVRAVTDKVFIQVIQDINTSGRPKHAVFPLIGRRPTKEKQHWNGVGRTLMWHYDYGICCYY